MVHYKFVYFPVRGLGEGVRLLFHYAEQDFEDVRIQHIQFPELKPTLKYGQVPYLEVDGKNRLYQSSTIARYLGEKFGLAGKSDWERAQVNEILDFHKDSYSALSPYFYVIYGFREGDKEKLRKEVFEVNWPRIAGIYEKLLNESGSGFMAKSGVTFIDFIIADWLDNSKNCEPNMLADHPQLQAYVDRVHGLPQLKSYLANRK